MSIIDRMRKQVAVVWSLVGHDGYGEPKYGEPFEVPCRWDDVATLYLMPSGEEKTSAAVVYPDRVIVLGSRMKLGTLAGLTEMDPRQNGTYEIKQHATTPNLRNTQNLYTCYLG